MRDQEHAMTMFLNGLWQGALLALVMWGIVKVTPGINAATRHALWWATLLAVVILPMRGLTFGGGDGQRSGEVAGKNLVAPEVAGNTAPGANSGTTGEKALPAANAGLRTSHTAAHWQPMEVAAGPVWIALLGAWVVVSAGLMMRLLDSYRWLQRVKGGATAAPARLEARLVTLAARAGVRRRGTLLISSEVEAPMVLGLTHPAIVIPKALLERLPQTDFDHVVLHELAHLGRYDDWTNLLQRLIEALFPVQPAVFWIGRQMGLEREAACDDRVIASASAATTYAASLTRVAEVTMWARSRVLASGALGRPSQLYRRVERLLKGRPNAPAGISRAATALGLGAVIAMASASTLIPPVVAWAQGAPQGNGAAAPGPEAGGAAGGGAVEKWESAMEFTKSQTFAVDAGKKLDVNVDQGNVHLSTWDQNRVKIVARFKGPDVAEFLKHFTTTMSSNNDGVQLEAKGDGWAGLGRLKVEIDYEIQTPARFNADVDNRLGNIDAANLQGTVKLVTKLGNVTLSEITGKVEAETNSGNVSAAECAGTLALDTKQGNVSATRFAGDSIQAESAMGNVAAEMTAAPKGDSGLTTKMGNVHLKLAKKAAVNLTMSTNMGNVNSDVGKGAINGGGPALRLETNMGNVTVTGE
jgi:beta-lactamase regulating signal transducer with metallopeptidase domain